MPQQPLDWLSGSEPPPDNEISRSEKSLHWADYVVLALFLTLNMAIGLYQSLKPAQKKVDTQDYFVGGRRMNYLTMAMSIVMSHVSAIIVIGGPAQIYTRGTLYWLFSVGTSLGQIFAGILFIPVLYPLKLTSVNEVSIRCQATLALTSYNKILDSIDYCSLF